MKSRFESMKHRGPEKTQFIVRYIKIGETEVMIVHGFHRLCINGLNPKADQPFCLADTVYCTNGEIWNCEQLHEESNTQNESACDCECVGKYYRHTGSFEKLMQAADGDFGIALYDCLDEKAYIGRDRLGVRSLYHAIDGEGNFYVASELKGIPHDLTNVQAFPPGHWASFDVKTRTLEMNSYYSLYPRVLEMKRPEVSIAELANNKEYLEFCKQIELSLTAAVKKRFMSDRPIGCILSGGLDSTTVTAIACKL
jgi:asparagine synthase (glutamine-hydrolysing)